MIFNLNEKHQEKPFVSYTYAPLSCVFFTQEHFFYIDYNCSTIHSWKPNIKQIQQLYAKSRFQQIHKDAPKKFAGKLSAFAECLWRSKEQFDVTAFITKVRANFATQYPEIGDIYQPCTITDPNKADNPIVYVNDSFAEMTGYHRDEIVGVNCRFLQGTFSDSDDVRILSDKIKTAQPHYIELLNYTKDGKPFWNNFACLPVFDEDKIFSFVAVQNDISLIKLDTDPRDWNAVEVALFATSIGFAFCSQLFITFGITGRRLSRMRKADLEALGIPHNSVHEFYNLKKDKFRIRLTARTISPRSLLTDISSSDSEVSEFPVIDLDVHRKEKGLSRSLVIKGSPDKEFSMVTRTKSLNSKTVIIGILPESLSWNQKNFVLLKELHQPLYQEMFESDPGHFNFIGFKPAKRPEDFPFMVVSAARRGHKAYFAEQTPIGYKQWSTGILGFVTKAGTLEPKALIKYLVHRYQFDKWKQIPNEQSSKKLSSIDDIRIKLLNFGVGVVYRKTGQSTRKEIFSNVLSQDEEAKFNTFLLSMGARGGSVRSNGPLDPGYTCEWQAKNISWYFGPEMTKDHQRQFLGNSLAMLVFNDGSDPFDILDLELGSVTCLVGVITPVRKKYRLDFYFHYLIDNQSTKHETVSIPNTEIPPEIPYNYLFDPSVLQDFVLAKIHNGLVVSSVYHPQLRKVTVQPLTRAFEDLARLYC